MSGSNRDAPIRIAVVTISDGVASGTREDVSGPTIVAWSASRGMHLHAHDVVADRSDSIVAALCRHADANCDVVLTTGGTGLTGRDVTPEATRAVIDREVPGIAEALRLRGAEHTRMSWLSRGIAGVRGSTLIVNLPGSIGGVRDGLEVLQDLIPHAVQLLRGVDTQQHPAPSGDSAVQHG